MRVWIVRIEKRWDFGSFEGRIVNRDNDAPLFQFSSDFENG